MISDGLLLIFIHKVIKLKGTNSCVRAAHISLIKAGSSFCFSFYLKLFVVQCIGFFVTQTSFRNPSEELETKIVKF